MAQYPAGAVTLEAESFGDPARPAVLLAMGLGMQLTAWPMELVEALVDAGYRVVRFDNRDAGLSTKLDGAAPVHLLREAARWFLHRPLHSPYGLRDMAADTVALLDALGIGRAHVVGASMGGMIAQEIAAGWPARTRSLVSVMSGSGCRALPVPHWRVLKMMLSRPPPARDFERLLAHYVKLFQALSGPGFPIDEGTLRARTAASLRRAHSPAGTARQLLAIAAAGDRSDHLRRIAAQTLVLHGDADPLLPLPHGRDCAGKIAGARLEVVKGMGHDLPPTLVPVLRDALLAHLRRVDGAID